MIVENVSLLALTTSAMLTMFFSDWTHPFCPAARSKLIRDFLFSRCQCRHSLMWGLMERRRCNVSLFNYEQIIKWSVFLSWTFDFVSGALLLVITDLKNSTENKKNIAQGEFRHVILLSGRQTKSSDRGGKRQKLADFNEVCILFQRFLFTLLRIRAVLKR